MAAASEDGGSARKTMDMGRWILIQGLTCFGAVTRIGKYWVIKDRWI